MRKHNPKMASRWGNATEDKDAPRMGHYLANNKSFQLAANSLLRGLIRSITK